MNDYRGRRCAFCHNEFEGGDDIVICPECGAPYHRDCYTANGHCIFSARHGDGFEYKTPVEELPAAERPRTCEVCQTENPPHTLFCEKCGHPLAILPQQEHTPQYAQPGQNGMGADGETRYAQPNVMTQLHLAKEYDGIDTKDWMQYIGNSAPYYLYQFQRMNESGRKISVCWSAMIFPEFYFFYRKMWGWGALALAVSLLVSVPPLLSMVMAVGIPLNIPLSARAVNLLVSCCGLLNWGVRIASCLFSFYLFRQSAGKRLRALRAENDSDEAYREQLAHRSGPSNLAVVLVGLLLIAWSIAFYMWIGPERLLNAFYL